MRIRRSYRPFVSSPLVAIAATFVASLGAATVHADIIASNLLPGDGYSVSGGLLGSLGGGIQSEQAVSFTTAADRTYVFTRVSVAIEINSSVASTEGIVVTLAADAGGAPGSALESLTLNIANGFTLYSAESVLRPVLSPGTRYWVVAPDAPTNRELVWRWAGVHSTSNHAAVRTRISGNPGPWTLSGDNAARGAFKVEGDPAAGACCNSGSLCAVTTPAQCESLGLRFLGHNTTCAPLGCSIVFPTGACCQGSVCTVTNTLFCAAVVGGPPGVFLGSGTTCSPATVRGRMNPCCPADFNNSGSASVQDLFDFLAVFFGGCP